MLLSNYPKNHTSVVSHPSIAKRYKDSIVRTSLPGPAVMKVSDGYFYLYATENIRNAPMYQSKDLVNWKFVGTAFSDDNNDWPTVSNTMPSNEATAPFFK